MKLFGTMFVFSFLQLSMLCAQSMQPFNMSFEIGNVGAEPVGWDCTAKSSQNDIKAEISSEKVFQGKHAFRIIRSIQNKIADTTDFTSVSQSVFAKNYIGKEVEFKTYISNTFNLWGYSAAYINVYDEKNQLISTTTSPSNNNSVDWHIVRTALKIPENAYKIIYGVGVFGNGEVFIDESAFATVNPGEKYNNPPAPVKTNKLSMLKNYFDIFTAVKYFYLSPECRVMDWDRIGIEGISITEQSANNEEFVNNMNKFFQSFVSDIQISAQQIKNIKQEEIESTSKKSIFAYRYLGFPNSSNTGFAKTDIIDITSTQRPNPGIIMQKIMLNPDIKGKLTLKVSSKFNSYSIDGHSEIWLAVYDTSGKQTAIIKNKDISDSPDSWKVSTLEVDLPANSETVNIGLLAVGECEAWFDKIEAVIINQNGKEQPLKIKNSGFEESNQNFVEGWLFQEASESAGYSYRTDKKSFAEGLSSLYINAEEKYRISIPQTEYLSRKIDNNCFLYMPLVFISDSLNTPIEVSKQPKYGYSSKPSDFLTNIHDRESRMLAIGELRGMLVHFPPEEINQTALDEAFAKALEIAANSKDADKLSYAADIILDLLHDNNARSWTIDSKYEFALPFLLKYHSGKILVSKVDKSEKEIQPGFVLRKINGVNAGDFLNYHSSISSSVISYWKILKSIAALRIGDYNSEFDIEFERPDGTLLKKKCLRSIAVTDLNEDKITFAGMLEDNIAYIDLTRISDEILKKSISGISKNKGIIFDLRGMANVSEFMVSLLTNDPIKPYTAMTGIYTMPFAINRSEIDAALKINSLGKLSGKEIVFLADERSIANAENILFLVKENKLGTIIGSPSSGSPNLYEAFDLPAGLFVTLSFSRPDLKQIKSFPVKPDIQAVQSENDIISGNDTVLQTALEFLRKKTGSK